MAHPIPWSWVQILSLWTNFLSIHLLPWAVIQKKKRKEKIDSIKQKKKHFTDTLKTYLYSVYILVL